MTSSEYKELKDQFLTNYPGELLTSSNTPSLAFLCFVKDAVESKTLSWIPWKRRSSESDELEYSEHRRPRTDKQLIRSILADGDVGFDDLPKAKVDTGGPVESVLTKFQVVLANALAITGACHLVVIKRFHQQFLELALLKPRDQHLRPPSLAEIIDAERAAWIAVAELMADGRWTLNDSLSEIAYCRQVFHTSLAARPRVVSPSAADPKKPPKRLPPPLEGTPKAKAKATVKPDPTLATGAGSKWQDHWLRKLPDGRGICIRFHLGKCKSGKTCRYAHQCPIPNSQGEACGGNHSAARLLTDHVNLY